MGIIEYEKGEPPWPMTAAQATGHSAMMTHLSLYGDYSTGSAAPDGDKTGHADWGIGIASPPQFEQPVGYGDGHGGQSE